MPLTNSEGMRRNKTYTSKKVSSSSSTHQSCHYWTRVSPKESVYAVVRYVGTMLVGVTFSKV